MYVLIFQLRKFNWKSIITTLVWAQKLYSNDPYASYAQDKSIKNTIWRSKSSRKLTTFHCIYRKFVTETSTTTRLTDWFIKISEKKKRTIASGIT